MFVKASFTMDENEVQMAVKTACDNLIFHIFEFVVSVTPCLKLKLFADAKKFMHFYNYCLLPPPSLNCLTIFDCHPAILLLI